jgi:hypothetical protein
MSGADVNADDGLYIPVEVTARVECGRGQAGDASHAED